MEMSRDHSKVMAQYMCSLKEIDSAQRERLLSYVSQVESGKLSYYAACGFEQPEKVYMMKVVPNH